MCKTRMANTYSRTLDIYRKYSNETGKDFLANLIYVIPYVSVTLDFTYIAFAI